MQAFNKFLTTKDIMLADVMIACFSYTTATRSWAPTLTHAKFNCSLTTYPLSHGTQLGLVCSPVCQAFKCLTIRVNASHVWVM